MKKRTALVLLSGGQDSTTALCWAMQQFAAVRAVSFDIRQTHARELQSAARVAERLKVPHQVIDASGVFIGLKQNPLLQDSGDSALFSQPKPADAKFPATFIPGRNLLFLTMAAIAAYPHQIRDLVIGVSEVDYSGYPDCRAEFIESAARSISLAVDEPFAIHAPFLHLSKADEVRLMDQWGQLDLLALTHSCYRGFSPPCGDCDACRLRAEGFAAAGIADPLLCV